MTSVTWVACTGCERSREVSIQVDFLLKRLAQGLDFTYSISLWLYLEDSLEAKQKVSQNFKPLICC